MTWVSHVRSYPPVFCLAVFDQFAQCQDRVTDLPWFLEDVADLMAMVVGEARHIRWLQVWGSALLSTFGRL